MQNKELQQLVERISLEYFNKPFRHKATFNRRLRTTGGRYFLMSHDIEFNIHQYEAYGESALIDIIKHELVHYHLHLEGKGYKHRDKDFKALSEQVGAPRYCQMVPKLEGYKYTYTCVQCKTEYHRKRKVNLDHVKCSVCSSKIELTRTW